MIDLGNGDWAQWDGQLGTYRASVGGTIYGATGGDIMSVASLASATSQTFSADQAESLAYDKGFSEALGGARPTTLSRAAFQQRFTPAEYLAIQESTDPMVVYLRDMQKIAIDIDVTDPKVIAGMNHLARPGGEIDPARLPLILARP